MPSSQTNSPIDAATRYCAVLGHPIRHSASPAMHNAAFRELGLNWRYLAFPVRPEDLSNAIAGAKAMGLLGLNLTVPHKMLALGMMDELDASAATWGAVNTVLFEGCDDSGAWRPLRDFADTPTQARTRGYNTDADAIVTSLKEDLGFEPSGMRVLLLGAGGAGRTAALRLASENPAELYLVNRTQNKAIELAEEVKRKCPGVRAHVDYPSGTVDLVLNATSLGLKPGDSLPLDTEKFSLRSAGSAYDMIYCPRKTPFLEAAEKAGCRSANGLGMLLHQGARALEIWTGRAAPVSTMRAALEAALTQ